MDASLHHLHGRTGQRLVSVHPSVTLELLAYMLTIIRASQQYDGLCWRSYDTNYRIAAAASGNRSWSKLDTDLFTRFFNGRARKVNPCMVCDALTHTSTDCPEAPAQPKRDETRPVTGPHPKRRRPFAKTWAADVCAEFNSKGVCSLAPDAATAMCAESVPAAPRLALARQRPDTPVRLWSHQSLISDRSIDRLT